MGGEVSTYKVGHEGLVDGGEVGSLDDEISTLEIFIFLIRMENGDEDMAEILCK